MIPRILHQTWKNTEVPARFAEAQESWRRHHPDWEYRFWTDADLDDFVQRQYPQMYGLFRAYPDQIQRVDAARYMILHHFGGFYSDLDIVCLHPFDGLLGHQIVLPRTEPLGVSNDLMGARAGSAFFAFAVSRLRGEYRRWPRGLIPRHFRVLLTTGSLFLTRTARAWEGPETPHILPAASYSIAGHPDALVAHIPGSTWHGRDSDLILGSFYRAKAAAEWLKAAFGKRARIGRRICRNKEDRQP